MGGWVVVRGAGGVVGRHVFGLRRDLAVAADEFYVVHIGAAAGHPFAADSARVARRGVNADAADELPPAPAGFQHGLRRAHTGPRRAVFIDGDLRGDGAEAEERAAAAHAERIRDAVHALRQVDGRALVERRLCSAAVSSAVPLPTAPKSRAFVHRDCAGRSTISRGKLG